MRIEKEKAARFAPLLFRRLCLALVSIVLFSMPLSANAPTITANIIQRTFQIRWRNSTGTAFAIDREAKQYLVTARHVVAGIESGNVIKILHEDAWKDLEVCVVGIGRGDIDVTVLACSIQLSPTYPIAPSAEGIFLGQSASFLGYPFGWDGGSGELNRGIPMPFVKAGIVSTITSGVVTKIYLDAHANRGFSGGPVVFYRDGQKRNGLSVAGIISNYPIPRSSLQPIVDSDGNPLTDPAGIPIGYSQENPGIVVAIGIRHAVEMIDTNPIGFQLSDIKENGSCDPSPE